MGGPESEKGREIMQNWWEIMKARVPGNQIAGNQMSGNQVAGNQISFGVWGLQR